MTSEEQRRTVCSNGNSFRHMAVSMAIAIAIGIAVWWCDVVEQVRAIAIAIVIAVWWYGGVVW